ncbi:MAG: hypothetical protein AAF441_22645 [Pseudomonadota bacterium]
MSMLIIDWGTRPDYLLRRLYPDARVVPSEPLSQPDLKCGELCGPGLCIFHINISDARRWFPDRAAFLKELESAGFAVVNGTVADIRKSNLQRLNISLGLPDVRVEKDFDPALKVIVKTDYNYGGLLEGGLPAATRRRLGLHRPSGPTVNGYDEYYVCGLEDVGSDLWNDERLVVERFVANAANAHWRFYRCGSRAVFSEIRNPDPIKKMVPGLPRRNWFFEFGEEPADAPLDALRNATRFVEALDVGYGAIDIAPDDAGVPHIIDLNLTPGWGLERQGEILDHLRVGYPEASEFFRPQSAK